MFDGVSFSDNVLLFHTSASAGQSGAVTTLRLGGVEFTNDTVSLGKYGPFALPSEVRDAKEPVQKLRKSAQEHVRECNIDHRFCRGVTKFVVLAEAARPVEPCESAFDDPALGQYSKQVLLVAFYDFDGVAKHIFCPVDQFAGVAAIGKDLGDRVEAAEQAHQHGPGRHTVLNAC